MGRSASQEILICCVAVLMGIGLVMVINNTAFARVADPWYMTRRQLMWMALAGCAMYTFAHVDHLHLARYSKFFLAMGFLGLIAVFVPGIGVERNEARRWVSALGFSCQPSEFMRLAIIIYMADRLTRKQQRIREFFHGLLPPVVIMGFTFGLVLMEPDFGAALMMASIVLAMLVVAGIRLVHVIPITILSAPLVVYIAVAKFAHVRDRLAAFFGEGGGHYQVKQSLIALGTGGLLGVGLGEGHQRLGFLPARHTDFVFSIIGEELGFLGAALVVALYILLMLEGMRICKRAEGLYSLLLGFGLLTALGIQAAVNIAVATGSTPAKGTALPFVSFGGSSMLSHAIGVGILLNIAGHQQEQVAPEALGAVPLEEE